MWESVFFKLCLLLIDKRSQPGLMPSFPPFPRHRAISRARALDCLSPR